MIVYELADDEIAALLGFAREIGIAELSASNPRLLEVIAFVSSELPRSLRRTLASFRLNEEDGVAMVRGCPIEDNLRATPAHWSETPELAPAALHEIVALLIASLLGDPFGRVTQQAGRVIQDVVPTKNYRREQRGSASDAGLGWHSEDAFHEYRPDYLALFCLRNPDSAATTYADVRTGDQRHGSPSAVRRRVHHPAGRCLRGAGPTCRGPEPGPGQRSAQGVDAVRGPEPAVHPA